MAGMGKVLLTAPKRGITLFGFIRKYWYFLVLLMVILPSIFHSISVARNTGNPTYPFFDLASRLLIADQDLDKTVNILRDAPSEIIGMEKPESGIWQNTKYYWLFTWRVVYRIIGDIWLLFFPMVIIWKVVHRRNTSENYKSFFTSLVIFLAYLFITNTIMFIYDIIQGNISVNIPAEMDKFQAYFMLFIKILPFHGIGNLIGYVFHTISV